MEIILPFWFWTFYRHLHVILRRCNKFYPNWTITERVMMLYRFFKMAATPSQIYFRFLVLWRLAFRKAKIYLCIKFWPDISIPGQVITTSGCWKQTSAIFKFYSQFRRTPHRHRYVILHRPANFARNRSATELWRHIDLTRWRLIASQIYLRFLIWPRLTFRKIQSYWHTKFPPDSSIHGRDIITSVWKQTAAILNFYFRFWFLPFHCHRHVVFHRYTKFLRYDFILIFKMSAVRYVGFGLG